jgi:hypothetical protein
MHMAGGDGVALNERYDDDAEDGWWCRWSGWQPPQQPPGGATVTNTTAQLLIAAPRQELNTSNKNTPNLLAGGYPTHLLRCALGHNISNLRNRKIT